MIDFTSRYYPLINPAPLVTTDGSNISYIPRRFLPQTLNQPVLTQFTVSENTRLDIAAAKILGNPLFFWKLADSNDAMNPLTLTQQPGQVLQVVSTTS